MPGKSKKRKGKEAAASDWNDDDSQIEEFYGEVVREAARNSVDFLTAPKKAKANSSKPIAKRCTFYYGDPLFMKDLRRNAGGQCAIGHEWVEVWDKMPPISTGHSKRAPTIELNKLEPLKTWTLWELLKYDGAAAGKLKTALQIGAIAKANISSSASTSTTDASVRRVLDLSIQTYAHSSFKTHFRPSKQSPSKKNYKVFTDADNCKYPGSVVLFGGSNWLMQFELSAGGVLLGSGNLGDCAGFTFSSKWEASFMVCTDNCKGARSVENALTKCTAKLFLFSAPEMDSLSADDFVVMTKKDTSGVLVEKARVRLTEEMPATACVTMDSSSIVKSSAAREEIIKPKAVSALAAESHMLQTATTKAITSSLMSSTASAESTTESAKLTEEMKALIRSEVNAQMNELFARYRPQTPLPRSECICGILPLTAPFGFGQLDPIGSEPLPLESTDSATVSPLFATDSSSVFTPPLADQCSEEQFWQEQENNEFTAATEALLVSSQTEDYQSEYGNMTKSDF